MSPFLPLLWLCCVLTAALLFIPLIEFAVRIRASRQLAGHPRSPYVQRRRLSGERHVLTQAEEVGHINPCIAGI